MKLLFIFGFLVVFVSSVHGLLGSALRRNAGYIGAAAGAVAGAAMLNPREPKVFYPFHIPRLELSLRQQKQKSPVKTQIITHESEGGPTSFRRYTWYITKIGDHAFYINRETGEVVEINEHFKYDPSYLKSQYQPFTIVDKKPLLNQNRRVRVNQFF